MDTLGKQMDSVLITGPGKGMLDFGKIDIPVPEADQVLIKVESIPINPTDLYMMEGKYSKYGDASYPFTPGFEGSGTVIESGGGFMAWRLKGKRVAFTRIDQKPGDTVKVGGSMAQYWVTNAGQCIILDDDTTFDQGCSFFVNPISAMGMIEILVHAKAQAVVITAAFSQLGRMLLRLWQEYNIKVIATVRKEEQIKSLIKEFGVAHWLNIQHEEFKSNMKSAIEELQPTHLLEWLSGDIAGQIISMMPRHATWVVYGALTQKKLSNIDSLPFVHKCIKIVGFNFGQWIKSKSLISKILIMNKINILLKSQLSTEFCNTMPLSQVKEAIELYTHDMSKGKIILKPFYDETK